MPPSHFQAVQALKHLQTPSPQSALMLISWGQSHGGYKTPPRADFSAELLLTQPAVITDVDIARFPKLYYHVYSNIYLFLFLPPCALPQSFSLSSAPARFPRITCSTVLLPRLLGHPDELFHGPCFPSFSQDSHGSPVASASLLPRFLSSFISGDSEFPPCVCSFVPTHEENY